MLRSIKYNFLTANKLILGNIMLWSPLYISSPTQQILHGTNIVLWDAGAVLISRKLPWQKPNLAYSLLQTKGMKHRMYLRNSCVLVGPIHRQPAPTETGWCLCQAEEREEEENRYMVNRNMFLILPPHLAQMYVAKITKKVERVRKHTYKTC